MVVLFPAPLWPRRAVICPSKKLRLRLLTTARSLNLRVKFFIEIPIGIRLGSASINFSLPEKKSI